MGGRHVFRRLYDFRARPSRAAILTIGAVVAVVTTVPSNILTPFVVLKLDAGDFAMSGVRRGLRHPPDYYGGRKYGMVKRFGQLTRRNSTDDGELSQMSMSVEVDDRRGRIRDMLAAGVVFDGKTIEWYDIDHASATAGGTPVMIGRGIMRQPSPGFDCTIQAVDPLAEWLRLEIPKPNRRVSVGVFTGLGTNGIPITSEGKPFQIVIGDFLGDPTEPGQILCLPLDTETIDGVLYGRMGYSCDAMSSIEELWIGDQKKAIKGVTSSNDYLVPGQYRWMNTSLGTDKTRLIGSQTWGILYIKASENDWRLARDGKVAVTITGVGAETVGDGSGTPIRSAPLQLLWLLTNHIIGNKITDTPEAVPEWGPGDPQIDESSFTDVDVALQDRLSGSYACSVLITDFVASRDVVGNLLRCGDFRLAPTRTMAARANVFDKDATPARALPYRRIRRGSFGIETRLDGHANQIVYSFGERQTQRSGWTRDKAILEDTYNITAYGRTVQSPTIAFPYLREVSRPNAAPVAALAGTGAGSVSNGTHRIAISYGGGSFSTSTPISHEYVSIVVVNNAVNGNVALTSLPVSADPLVTIKTVWMTKAGLEDTYYFVAQIDNADTSYTITGPPDVGLSLASPTENQHPTVAENNAYHRLARMREPRYAPRLGLRDMRAAELELGDVVTVTHPIAPVATASPATTGYVERRLEIEAITVDPDVLASDLETLDQDQVLDPFTFSALVSRGTPYTIPLPVEQTDPDTGTGPPVGGKASFPTGHLKEDGELAASADTWQQVSQSSPRSFPREEMGRRPTFEHIWLAVAGGATATVAIKEISSGDQIGESVSTSSATIEELIIDVTGLLYQGDAHKYDLFWQCDTTTDLVFLPHSELQVL